MYRNKINWANNHYALGNCQRNDYEFKIISTVALGFAQIAYINVLCHQIHLDWYNRNKTVEQVTYTDIRSYSRADLNQGIF